MMRKFIDIINEVNEPIDWYDRRNELRDGMVFRDREGDLVKLDQRVEGDGTKWEVAIWWGNSWTYEGSTIEPGDLRGEPLPDPAEKKNLTESTGLDCSIWGHKGKWYYALEQGEWSEEDDLVGTGTYDSYGPFPSKDAALKDLNDNHANPGGFSIIDYDESGGEPSQGEQSLMARAKILPPRNRWGGGFPRF